MAALALREAGYEVRAATVKLWPGDDQRSCCSPAAVARARDSAHAIGAPHFSVNDEPRFAADVVAPFVASYLAGETPNPCVECNPGRLARLVAADRHQHQPFAGAGRPRPRYPPEPCRHGGWYQLQNRSTCHRKRSPLLPPVYTRRG